MGVKLLIGADIAPVESNYELFRMGEREKLIGKELCDLLDSSDYIIFNLEVPLTDKWNPIQKCGPNLTAPMECISGLRAINPYFFTLANNHIMDQGVQGLYSTINVLEKNNIAYAGAGKDLKEAAKPYIANIKGIKFGIYCCAEHEFSIAAEAIAGANPYDPLESFDHVRALKKNCDYVIVLYHGGKEHYRYPSPILQKVFKKFADCGADLVIAQHTHCIGCAEEYKGSLLVYGQGNFLFDGSQSDFWKTSVLVQMEITNTGKNIEFIPLCKEKNTVRIANNAETEKILSEFQNRSNEIKEENFIREHYINYALSMRKMYNVRLSGGFGRNPFVRVINKLTGYMLTDIMYNKKHIMQIENCIDCEAHREALLCALQNERKK